MKKVFSLLILLVITAISLFGQQYPSVTLTSAQLTYNNSVGNEWSYSVAANDTALFQNRPVTINAEIIVLKVTVREDEKYPDYGSGSQTINLSDLGKGEHHFQIDVIVREDRGRYSGNTAGWRFEFAIFVP